MGLMDRIGAAKRWMVSPMQVWMADLGSDKLAHAGQPAKVVVDVRGEDDGTAERIEVFLQMIGWGNDEKVKWPLGEVPVTLGTHELQVTLPTGLAPACSRYAEYTFEAQLHRTKGTGSNAASIVDVVSRVEDLYWPDGARSGQEGPDDARVTIALDAETVSVGEALSGRATIFAMRELSGDDVRLAFGPTVDTLVPVAGKSQPQPRARFKPMVELELADKPAIRTGEQLEIPFSIDVPAGVPPTLHNGGQTSVVWQVRVELGKTAGWRLVGVLDPEAAAGRRNEPSQGLISFLASLDTTR
ncbi:MAG: hypothetical protein QOH00_423 [Gaiellales bacterium]|jgi:hypothetical protein|nr:hypothetical protein [Gaiellales bacterium]